MSSFLAYVTDVSASNGSEAAFTPVLVDVAARQSK